MELYPAVLKLTDEKNDDSSLSLIFILPIVPKLLYSNKNIRIVPKTIRVTVVSKATLLCKDILFNLLLTYISCHTGNPSPPTIIRTLIVNIIVISS
ncbi:hypothetical protein D3C73_1172570 [compost metagenome]